MCNFVTLIYHLLSPCFFINSLCADKIPAELAISLQIMPLQLLVVALYDGLAYWK